MDITSACLSAAFRRIFAVDNPRLSSLACVTACRHVNVHTWRAQGAELWPAATACRQENCLRSGYGARPATDDLLLFGRQRTRRIVTFLFFFVRLINTLTYLLTYLLLIDSWSSIQQMVVDQAIDH